MKSQHLVAAVLVVSSLGTAQVLTTFKTVNPTYVMALNNTPHNKLEQKVQAKTDLKTGLDLSRAISSASATLGVAFKESPGQILAEFDGHVKGRHVGGMDYTIGSFDTVSLLTIRAAIQEKCVLRLTWRSSNSDKGIHDVSVAIDNGMVFKRRSLPKAQEFFARDFPITIGKKDVNIQVVFTATAGWNNAGNSNAFLGLQVLPAECGFLKYGVVCGPNPDGPSLSGVCEFGTLLKLNVTGAEANAVGILVLGTNLTAQPIPHSSCLLYTDVLLSMPFKFSSTGTWELPHVLPPPSHRPVTMAAQVGAFGTKLRTSNGLVLSLVR